LNGATYRKSVGEQPKPSVTVTAMTFATESSSEYQRHDCTARVASAPAPAAVHFAYNLEHEVQRIWLQQPGISTQIIWQEIMNLHHPGKFAVTTEMDNDAPQEPAQRALLPTKKQIKRIVKETIPYRQGAAKETVDGRVEQWIQGKLQERMTLLAETLPDSTKPSRRQIQNRLAQRAQADQIYAALTAMGVEINDHYRTWHVNSRETIRALEQALSADSSSSDTVAIAAESFNVKGEATGGVDTSETVGTLHRCETCLRSFTSRNRLYKHLRDVESGSCGTILWAKGQSIQAPPSIQKKQLQKQEVVRKVTKTGRTACHAHASQCLWVGDLPLLWTRTSNNYQRLRTLLFSSLPQGVPQPWIKKVIRKAYRGRNGAFTTDQSNYLGYAIVVFRDEVEAKLVLQHLDQMEINPQVVYKKNLSQNGGEHEACCPQSNEQDELLNLLNSSPFLLKVSRVVNSDTSAPSLPQDLRMLQTNHCRQKQSMPICSDNVSSENQTTACTQWLPSSEIPYAVKVDTESDVSCGIALDSLSGLASPFSSLFSTVPPGLDPPLADQLRPLTAAELRRRIDCMRRTRRKTSGLENASSGEPSLADLAHDVLVTVAADEYKLLWASEKSEQGQQERQLKRREVHHCGRPVPRTLTEPILRLLESLRWPAQNQRPGLSAERYLVLYSNSAQNDPFYHELRAKCFDLMQWADHSYYYSGIAVTKNFCASPHIDDRDQSYQYAISLGTFKDGGELCVEGRACDLDEWENSLIESDVLNRTYDYVNVVSTHNRIARVDGRNVHWVRTWTGGDRYSLIFYDTSDRNIRPVTPTGVIVDKSYEIMGTPHKGESGAQST
jgi:hypothetical protein